MSTKSKAIHINNEEAICQGDIFRNVKYSYIDSEDIESVDIIEYEFPLAVIISQACDTIAMNRIVSEKSGKPTKFMPAILMCPIYEKDSVKFGTHIEEAFVVNDYKMIQENSYHSDDYKVALRDWHYRYHALEVSIDNRIIIEKAIVDFKHYFTVPMSYLEKHKMDRVMHLEDVFAEQLTLKFATYLSRVAIPDE